MPAPMLPSRSARLGKALPVLLLSVLCALCACTSQDRSPAPAAADPDRENSEGASLQSPPPVTEQRIGEPAQPQVQPTPAQAESGYIILQPGETLSYISVLYAVSEKDLISWNGLSSAHDVRAGQRLAIRPPVMQSAQPAPQATTPYTQAAAPAKAEAAAPDGVIIVSSGQHLSGIAQRHGVTVAQLREWNKLTSDKVRIGQSLRVQPPPAQASASIGLPAVRTATADAPDADGMITVQSGQSLSVIAATYMVSTADLRQWNKLKSDQIKIGQKLRVQAPTRVHTVKEGESLGGIAAKYKVSTKALIEKNKIAKPDVLPAGKRLIIP